MTSEDIQITRASSKWCQTWLNGEVCDYGNSDKIGPSTDEWRNIAGLIKCGTGAPGW
jgi:hypothetical protein